MVNRNVPIGFLTVHLVRKIVISKPTGFKYSETLEKIEFSTQASLSFNLNIDFKILEIYESCSKG